VLIAYSPFFPLIEIIELRMESSANTRLSFDLSLYAVTDSSLNRKHNRSLLEVVKEAIKGGATLIQLREKNISSLDFMKIAQEIVDYVHALPPPGDGKVPVRVLINDRVDIALAVQADGVHLGQSDLPASVARRLLPPHMIMGITANTVELAKKAEADGADYVGSGSIFITNTKSDATPLSFYQLADICSSVSIPVTAIGGITTKDIPRVFEFDNVPNRKTLLSGVALVSAIFDKEDVCAATAEIKEIVKLYHP
jgi:thiamine-phosphate diphosphorylase